MKDFIEFYSEHGVIVLYGMSCYLFGVCIGTFINNKK